MILTIKSTAISTDEEGVETELEEEMVITFDPAEKRLSRLSENMDISLTDEEVLAMSNYMNGGLYINVNGTLYGYFKGGEFASGNLEVSGNKVSISDTEIIAKDCTPTYLTSKDESVFR